MPGSPKVGGIGCPKARLRMQLSATRGVYDHGIDNIRVSFQELIKNPPDGFLVIEGNAGLGADWPAAIWKSASGFALALTIFSAPSSIEENWPRWKEIFDKARESMLRFHGEYQIDRDTAQVLAMQHAVAIETMDSGRLELRLAIRHHHQIISGYDDLLIRERIDMYWPERAQFGTEEFSQGVKSSDEAAKQVRCRYIFGFEDQNSSRTVVVEKDGVISFCQKLYP
jgi:hypothetical protein